MNGPKAIAEFPFSSEFQQYIHKQSQLPTHNRSTPLFIDVLCV